MEAVAPAAINENNVYRENKTSALRPLTDQYNSGVPEVILIELK